MFSIKGYAPIRMGPSLIYKYIAMPLQFKSKFIYHVTLISRTRLLARLHVRLQRVRTWRHPPKLGHRRKGRQPLREAQNKGRRPL